MLVLYSYMNRIITNHVKILCTAVIPVNGKIINVNDTSIGNNTFYRLQYVLFPFYKH